MQESVTKDRERFLGGSDIPSVMGISPFTSRMDMLLYKAQLKTNDFKGNRATEYGNAMESKIRDYINSEYGYNFVEDKKIADGDVLPIRYHADGYSENENAILEVKTTSEIHEKLEDYKMYLVQLVTGMTVYGAKRGVLAVYDRPEDLSLELDSDRLQVFTFGEERRKEIWEEVEPQIDAFRKDYLYLKENPLADEDELPSRKNLAEWEQKSLLIGDREFTAEWLLGAEKEITDAIKSLKEELCEQMEEHGIEHCDFSNGARVTYVPKGKDTETEKLDDKRLKEEEPSIYAKYLKKSVRKGKKAYVLIKH